MVSKARAKEQAPKDSRAHPVPIQVVAGLAANPLDVGIVGLLQGVHIF
jgi:hypothetical protein